MARAGAKFWVWSVAALVVVAAVAAAWILSWGPFASPGPEPSPSPSAVVSPSPSVSETPPPVFAERPVTVAAHVPSAEPITEAVLETATTGWVVAIHDATSIDDTGVETPGPRVLYLISPDGTRYELANLDVLGFSAPDVLAWDTERQKILLVNHQADLEVFDMISGQIDTAWSFCSNQGDVKGSARDGAWLLRGSCDGENIDGLYSDMGTEIPSSIVGRGFGLTVFDIGDVQVRYEFDSAPDEHFTAFYPDGTEATIPTSMAGDCHMIGKGRGATFVAYCYTDSGALDVWEFPVDGSTPEQVITSEQLDAFRIALGISGPDDFFVSGYCADSDYRVVEVTSDKSRLGVLRDGIVEQAAEPPYEFRHCLAASGTAALVSGDGLLWYTDFATDLTVELLPGAGDDYPLHVVGTEGYRALLHR